MWLIGKVVLLQQRHHSLPVRMTGLFRSWSMKERADAVNAMVSVPCTITVAHDGGTRAGVSSLGNTPGRRTGCCLLSLHYQSRRSPNRGALHPLRVVPSWRAPYWSCQRAQATPRRHTLAFHPVLPTLPRSVQAGSRAHTPMNHLRLLARAEMYTCIYALTDASISR